MKTNLDLARLLVRKAESDLANARRTLDSPGPYDTGLFHCQQAVEKYLKALLATHDVEYPKIHDVAELAERSLAFCPALHSLPFEMAEFNPFAVTIRYDDWDEEIEPELLAEVLADAIQVRAAIRAVLPEKVAVSLDTST
jgi:HEPN domain-containing protein